MPFIPSPKTVKASPAIKPPPACLNRASATLISSFVLALSNSLIGLARLGCLSIILNKFSSNGSCTTASVIKPAKAFLVQALFIPANFVAFKPLPTSPCGNKN